MTSQSDTPKVPFQDREEALEEILSDRPLSLLINIYGEPGIGKSRLLEEAKIQVHARHPLALVMYVDLQSIARDGLASPEALLRAIIAQTRGQLRGIGRTVDEAAGEVVEQLGNLADLSASEMPVYLMIDTTECVQQDRAFWQWMETRLIVPLVTGTRVRQIYAGQMRAPWMEFEVRQAIKFLELGPLDGKKSALALIVGALKLENPSLTTEQANTAAGWLHELSFGHPRLSEQLARSAAARLPVAADQVATLQGELSAKVVKPFIDDYLLKDVEPVWQEIVYMASVFDQFDPWLLPRFLEQCDPVLAQGRTPNFYITGVDCLRRQHALVIWREREGYGLQSLARKIIVRNLALVDPERYLGALEAAVETYEALAKEALPDSTDAANYRAKADRLRTISKIPNPAKEELP